MEQYEKLNSNITLASPGEILKEWRNETLKDSKASVFLDHDKTDGVGAEIIHPGISADRSVTFHIIVFSEKNATVHKTPFTRIFNYRYMYNNHIFFCCLMQDECKKQIIVVLHSLIRHWGFNRKIKFNWKEMSFNILHIPCNKRLCYSCHNNIITVTNTT